MLSEEKSVMMSEASIKRADENAKKKFLLQSIGVDVNIDGVEREFQCGWMNSCNSHTREYFMMNYNCSEKYLRYNEGGDDIIIRKEAAWRFNHNSENIQNMIEAFKNYLAQNGCQPVGATA